MAVSIKGTHSYGIGLARAADRGRPDACLVPNSPPAEPGAEGQVRPDRRPPGGARRAAPGRRPATHPPRRRTARRCGSCSVPVSEMTTTSTTQTNRLRALLLGGNTSTAPRRGPLTDDPPGGPRRRRASREPTASRPYAHQSRRLALALREPPRALKANRAQLQTIVDDTFPVDERRGVGPSAPPRPSVSFSRPQCRNGALLAASAAPRRRPAAVRTVRHRLDQSRPRWNQHSHVAADPDRRGSPTSPGLRHPHTATRPSQAAPQRFIAASFYRTLRRRHDPGTAESADVPHSGNAPTAPRHDRSVHGPRLTGVFVPRTSDSVRKTRNTRG